MELLTPREWEVASLVALGHTNVEIARRLEISSKTVEAHRKHIMTKLRLRSRADVVRFALDHGLMKANPGRAFSHQCPGCKIVWHLRATFLSDREVRFLGYQPARTVSSPGFLMFHHDRCRTTLPLALESLKELSGGPLLAPSCAVTGKKNGHCLANDTLQPCPLRCVCASVWRLSQIINHWPKNRPEPS